MNSSPGYETKVHAFCVSGSMLLTTNRFTPNDIKNLKEKETRVSQLFHFMPTLNLYLTFSFSLEKNTWSGIITSNVLLLIP